MALERNAAFVDLSTGEVKVKEIPRDVREKYLGGRGIDAYLLYNLIKPGTDPLGPDNVLLVSTGLLTGTPSPAPSRTQISAKSPLTNLLGSANMGGFFSAELRYAGFDHLIITGKADKPVYLWVNDGTIEIRDAAHLWGKDTVETMVLVREEMDDEDVKVLTIGIGGENLVRYANVMTGIKNAGGRTGMGAVMGSKNLKAIATRGSLPIPLADPQGALAYHKEMVDYIQGSKFAEIMGTWGTLYIYDVTNSTGLIRTRNFQSNQSQFSEDLEAEAIEPYSVGTAACYGCTMHCRHKYKIKDGPWKGVYDEGPEYTTQGAFGTEVGCTSMHTLLVGNHLVNRLGIDTLEVGSMIGWAMELYEKGLLPKELVGDLDLTWGNDEAVLQLTQDIAHRRGLGDILAEGPLRAAEKLGPETLQYNIQIKGMSNLQSDERATPALALNIATSTRGADHLRSRPAIDLYHLPEPVLAKIYGKKGLSSDYRDYDGKAWQVYWQACLYAVVDALGICKFQTVFMSPNSPTFPEYSKMIELVAGIKLTPEQVMEVGDRIYTTERMFNLREGATRADDWLPERYFDEPVPAGLDAVRGLFIDREKFTKMLDEYYEHHGWDEAGVPTPETLTRLNLDQQPAHVL